jgi:nucleoside-diphosphate-sugar epimerase
VEPRTVLVTGAAGRLGRAVVPELLAGGWRVVAADRRPPADGRVAGVPVTAADLTDPRAAEGLVDGCAAVVHLAGIPTPYGLPGHEVFGNNTAATFHVLDAAARAGVRTVALASSTAAYGFTFAPTSPRYVPVDEEHPLLPQDPYALSRAVDEATGAMLARRHRMTVVALRLNWVATAEEIARRVREVAADPDTGRSAAELWGYLELGEAAAACRAALAAPPGFHAVNVAAPDTLSEIPTGNLLARYHPGTPVRPGFTGSAGAWSTARAARVLGFAPRWSWRTELTKENHPS